jgi:hypothetical protein
MASVEIGVIRALKIGGMMDATRADPVEAAKHGRGVTLDPEGSVA